MVTSDVVLRAKFSARLNEALDDAGYPPPGKGRQGKLSKRYKVSSQAAGKWIAGDAIPELPRVMELAVDTGVAVEWLLTGRGEKQAPRGGSAVQVAGEPVTAYAVIRRDVDLVRELLAGVLSPLGLRMESCDIDSENGLRLTAAWSEPQGVRRRGVEGAGSTPPSPGQDRLHGQLSPPQAGARRRRASEQ